VIVITSIFEGVVMTNDATEEILAQHGFGLVAVDSSGFPEVTDEVFTSTFREIALIVGRGNNVGTGCVHTTTRWATKRSSSLVIVTDDRLW
jgi:hypothetical protein